MKSMSNSKVIKAIEKFAFQKYLEKLVDADMHKVTLFGIFPQTGAPNYAAAAHYLIVDELEKIVALNSGKFLN